MFKYLKTTLDVNLKDILTHDSVNSLVGSSDSALVTSLALPEKLSDHLAIQNSIYCRDLLLSSPEAEYRSQ
jgi:hypothetical protein